MKLLMFENFTFNTSTTPFDHNRHQSFVLVMSTFGGGHYNFG